MELKKLLESHFSGTAIRDVAADFILKQLPQGLVVISAIRDPMLGTYRWPMIHGGTAEAAQLLIKDIQAAFEKGNPLEYHSLYRRIYFYRDNNTVL